MARATDKSREEITKANLSKTLAKLKKQVAGAEELWLEIFTEVVLPPVLASAAEDSRISEGDVMAASLVADWILDAYERRWGKMAESLPGEPTSSDRTV